MAAFVTFASDQEKERAMNLILDRYFSIRTGFVISDLDAEILKQANVKFEVEKATMEILTK